MKTARSRIPASVAAMLLAVVTAGAAAEPAGDARRGTLTWVESTPVETELDLPDVPDARDVWPRLIAAARDSIEVLAFYLSEDPDRRDPLDAVLAALDAAAARGVAVRVLADRGFDRTYPQIARRLDARPGIEVRLIAPAAFWGGVQHAKAFAVDGTRFFLGSQNWDWRALMHIHELGVVIENPTLTRRFRAIYALDWRAGTAPDSAAEVPRERWPLIATREAVDAAALDYVPLVTAAGDTIEAALAASPAAGLPPGTKHDLPALVALLDGARERIRVQLLSYNPTDRDGRYWAVLDDALRRAAARGVAVEILLSNWAKRSFMLPYIQSLAVLPSLEIRFTNIPEWSEGFVPYARVDHAKFATVDGRTCWLGTANWSRDYFDESRNISLFLRGAGACDVPDRFFEKGWHSPHAEVVDPCGSYAAPRRP